MAWTWRTSDRHADPTALLACSRRSWLLDMKPALTRLAATSCAVDAATSLDATMSCSGLLRLDRTPSAVSISVLVDDATALAAEMRPSLGQPGGGGGDGVGRFAQLRVHQVSQVPLVVRQLAEAGREALDQLVELLQLHLHVVVAVDDNVRLLQRLHSLEAEALQASEKLHRGLGRLPRALHQRVVLLVVRGQAHHALCVAAHVGDGAGKDVDGLDEVRVRAVGSVGDEVVERGGELHGAAGRLLDLREHVRRRRVLVAGLHGRVQLVQGVVHARDAGLQHRVDDVVDLVQVRQDEGIDLAVERVVRLSLVLLQLVQLYERLVHAGLVDLELLLLVAQELLEVGIAGSDLALRLLQRPRLVSERLFQVAHLAVVLGEHRGELVALAALEVVRAVLRHAQLSLEPLELVLVAAAGSVLVVQRSVALPDHVGQLEVLRLDLSLELLALLDGLLRACRLELHRLEFLQEIQVLVAKLRVQLREGLRFDLVVLAAHLLPVAVLDLHQLALEGLDALVVLLQHQLVALVLGSRVEVFSLELGQAALGLPLCLLREERLLLSLLLLHQTPLLLLELALGLLLRLLLRQESSPLPLFEDPLLLLVFAILAIQLPLPKLGDFVRLVRLGRRRRRRPTFDFLLWPGGQSGSLVIGGKEVWRVLRQLGDRNKARQVPEIGALIVEFDQAVMLGVVPLPKGLQRVVVAGDCAGSRGDVVVLS
ncbi:hypothetical protein Trco_003647 [Trichoderma cornu-damae]|uniref:Uncharacterized protein n=1 Tax=Trichoderma cornu-damae TaxID=654480 RepID=A0A9P8QLF9_9HYPO|nr:hypothetical protein Trco_003647 [Trichoderma cornu-damae]